MLRQRRRSEAGWVGGRVPRTVKVFLPSIMRTGMGILAA